MGRPLSKILFGANARNNIKVQFNNGTDSVPGYIIEQTGSKRFKCKDADGNTAVCYLRDKASADLQPGEMSITLKYDDGTVQQATKISRHRITVMYGGVSRSFPWNFSTSVTDGAWQIEEAGTDAALDDATDLEGDDIAYTLPPGMSLYEPLDGSGGNNSNVPGSNYKLTGSATSINPNATAQGTPAAPGGFVASVPNSAAGLWREKYVPELWSTQGAWAEFDVAFFSVKSHGPFKGASATPYFGFGNRTDLGSENHYTLHWKGYFQAPATGNFTVWTAGSVDDDAGVWIGSAALAPIVSNANAFVTGDVMRSTNSVSLVAGKWYPIRMVFVEFGGAEACQFALQDATNHVVYTGLDLTFAYNTLTKGF